MIGFNGGLIGTKRTTSTLSASGLWTTNEQVVRRRSLEWPNFTANDPYFNSVSLLVQPSGPIGSTSFTNLAPSGLAITRFGNTVQSDTQLKYSSASAYFDGSGDYLQLEDATAFNLSGVNGTIETWFYTELTRFQHLIYKGTYGSNEAWALGFSSTGFSAGTANGGASNYLNVSVAVPANQWHHVAWTNTVGSGTQLWFNGQLVGTKSVNWTNASAKITIGCGTWNSPQNFFKGYMSGVRITKGTARYTSNFPVPEDVFPAQ